MSDLTCPRCKGAVPRDAQFCPHCGISKDEATALNQGMVSSQAVRKAVAQGVSDQKTAQSSAAMGCGVVALLVIVIGLAAALDVGTIVVLALIAGGIVGGAIYGLMMRS